MKKLPGFVVLAVIIALTSCDNQCFVKDRKGSLGLTSGPAEKTFRLNREKVSLASEGRLGMMELSSTGDSGKIIPVQWDISESDRKSNGVILIPYGLPGNRRLILSESKTKFETLMQASEDPISGQIIITDDSKPVLRYNYKTVFEKDAIDTLPANKYSRQPNDTFMANPSIYAVPRSNYIHPLYGPEGELLTRDWSKDHPHHRGIYWAWPEVEFGTRRGDLHALQIVFARPTGNIKLRSGPVYAQVEAENIWMWEDREPVVREVAVIRAYRQTLFGRVIDLSFRFDALKDSVTLARRETKYYGGLNIRMQTPKMQEISFLKDSSVNKPRRAWSDLSGLFSGADTTSGLLVLQHHKNPDYPGEYIQYPDLAWIQPTFPTSGTRYKLTSGRPLVLRYRLLVHSGMKPDNDFSSLLWDAFNSEIAPELTFSIRETQQGGR
jgi:hypothetical protein